MRIAIIGAGPGGLTLGSILARRNIEFTIFEAEQSLTARNQGGSLDLHIETGQLALREAGVFELFKKHARPEGDCTKVLKYDGTVIIDENKRNESLKASVDEVLRPEIDRLKLREILLDSIPVKNVEWGKKVVQASQTPDNSIVIVFDDKDKKEFDLVVGGDGAWSKIRPLLSDIQPHYSSVTIVELWAFNISKNHPKLVEYTGNGSSFVFAKDRCVIAQRNGDDSIRVYASLRVPENWNQGDNQIDWDAANCREHLVSDYFQGCGDNIKEAIIDSTDNLILRPIHMLPIGFKWNHKQGVTLLGDSAHVMSPFAGEGVNLAMKDALELANSITNAGNTARLDANITEYEVELFKRAEKYAQDTWNSLELCFSEGGSEKFVEIILGH